MRTRSVFKRSGPSNLMSCIAVLSFNEEKNCRGKLNVLFNVC